MRARRYGLRNPYEVQYQREGRPVIEYVPASGSAVGRVRELRRYGFKPSARFVSASARRNPSARSRAGRVIVQPIYRNEPRTRKGVIEKMAKRKKGRKSRGRRAPGSGKVYRPALHRSSKGWTWKRKSKVLRRGTARRSGGHVYLNPPKRRRSYRRYRKSGRKRSHRARSNPRRRAFRRYRRNPDFMGAAMSVLTGGLVGAAGLLATKWLINVIPFTRDASDVLKGVYTIAGGAVIGAAAWFVTKNKTLALTAAIVPAAVGLLEIVTSLIPALAPEGASPMTATAPGNKGVGDDEDVQPGDVVIGDDGEEYEAVADGTEGVGFERQVAGGVGFEKQVAGGFGMGADPLIVEGREGLMGVGADPLIVEYAT